MRSAIGQFRDQHLVIIAFHLHIIVICNMIVIATVNIVFNAIAIVICT